jgi:hypothetical protein
MTGQDDQPAVPQPPAGPPPAPPAPPAAPPPALGSTPGAWPSADPGATGWQTPPAPSRSRRNWVIGCLVLVVVLVVGVGACTVLALRSFGPAGAVLVESSGEIDAFNVQTFNGQTEIVFTAARGIDEADGPRLACQVIGPTLAGTDLDGTDWVLVNRAGDAIATNETPCP